MNWWYLGSESSSDSEEEKENEDEKEEHYSYREINFHELTFDFKIGGGSFGVVYKV
jgi:hypothetical protein